MNLYDRILELVLSDAIPLKESLAIGILLASIEILRQAIFYAPDAWIRSTAFLTVLVLLPAMMTYLFLQG